MPVEHATTRNLLSHEQWRTAQAMQSATGQSLDEILIELGFCTQETALAAVAQRAGLPLIELIERELDPRVIALIPTELAFRHQALPLSATPTTLRVAIADPFNTAGLVIDPSFHQGFSFEIWDVLEHKKVLMNCPEEMYDMLALIGAKSRYVIKRVYCRPGGKLPEDEPVAAISTEKLYQTAGRYVGKDDPVASVRSQSGLPALGEVLEPLALGIWLAAGCGEVIMAL